MNIKCNIVGSFVEKSQWFVKFRSEIFYYVSKRGHVWTRMSGHPRLWRCMIDQGRGAILIMHFHFAIITKYAQLVDFFVNCSFTLNKIDQTHVIVRFF